MEKIKVLDKEATAFDQAYNYLVVIQGKKIEKIKKNATMLMQSLLMTQHTCEIIELEGKKCCPRCHGIQENTFKGNAYFCPYCGQKIQDKNES